MPELSSAAWIIPTVLLAWTAIKHFDPARRNEPPDQGQRKQAGKEIAALHTDTANVRRGSAEYEGLCGLSANYNGLLASRRLEECIYILWVPF